MKKILFLFFAIASLAAKSQTVSEITNILNTKPKSIGTTAASALNADLLSAIDMNTFGYRLIGVDIIGTWVGTITVQGSNDNFTTVSTIAVYQPGSVGVPWQTTITSNGHYNIPTIGFRYIRIRMTAYTSGTANSIAYGFLNNIDHQNNASFTITGTIPVSGTFWQATQPVSISGNVPVTGTFWQATQPVSGPLTDAQLRATAVPVTANVGTTNGLALDATLTNKTQFVKITDATNDASVKAASAAAIATDKALVVAVSPNNSVAVTGVFWQATQPISGTVTANAGTGTFATNVFAINGQTPLMGNGVTGIGSQRVTIASDNTPFSVNAGLLAGSNLVGKFGIDQTTVGTTNAVSLAQIGANTVSTGNGVAGTGVQRVTIASDNTTFPVSATLQANSGVDIGKLTANQSVNISQINAVTPLMGNGITGTGSQRVTIASDNTAFAINNTQQGTASQNVAQVNGVTTLTGNGVTGTGSQRVTIASDNTAFAVNNTQQGTASQNVAQIAGTTALTGNGVTGAGSQRVTIASDNTAFPVNATLQTGANAIGKLTANSGVIIGDVNVVAVPALTKGTQGATGFSTQDLKDAGRTTIALTIEVAGAATTEALATVTESRNGAATGTFTSKVITNGKRIRFQSVAMEVETLGSGTVPQRVWLRLRVNTAGATTASSPQQSVWSCVNNFAAVKSGATSFYSVLDGLEYLGDGTATYGLTLTFPDWVTTTATVQVKITVFAFEY